jgi:hypothetical protein
MYLRLTLNLLHFLPYLGALYALLLAPNFYEIHPYFKKSLETVVLDFFTKDLRKIFDALCLQGPIKKKRIAGEYCPAREVQSGFKTCDQICCEN